jgi:hypothetical protein
MPLRPGRPADDRRRRVGVPGTGCDPGAGWADKPVNVLARRRQRWTFMDAPGPGTAAGEEYLVVAGQELRLTNPPGAVPGHRYNQGRRDRLLAG